MGSPQTKTQTSKASRTKWKIESKRSKSLLRSTLCPRLSLYLSLFLCCSLRYTLHSLLYSFSCPLHFALYSQLSALLYSPPATTHCQSHCPCPCPCPLPVPIAIRCCPLYTRSCRGEWTQGDAVVVVAVTAGVAVAAAVDVEFARQKRSPFLQELTLFWRR